MAEPLERRLLLYAGQLDTTFSSDGRVTLDLAGDDRALDVAVQTDGKLVVITATNVLRYNANGSLDTSFSGIGVRPVSFDSQGTSYARAVAVQPDGKIIVVGTVDDPATTHYSRDRFGVARFTSTGAVDNLFSGDGMLTVDFGGDTDLGEARDVVVQSDGKIVVAGRTRRGSSDRDDDFAVIRLTTTGAMDSMFNGGGGRLVTGFGLEERADRVAIDSLGRLVVAGITGSPGGAERFAVLRLTAAGEIDNTFSGDGKAATTVGGFGSTVGLVVQGTKIVVSGAIGSQNAASFGVTRFNADGTPDSSFGTGGTGMVTTEIGDIDVPFDMLETFGKKLIVAGTSHDKSLFGMVAYTADGALESNFDLDGKLITQFSGYSGANTGVNALAIYPHNNPDGTKSGKFVAAGGVSTSTGTVDLGMARYFDLGPTVNIYSVDPVGSETGPSNASFYVLREGNINFTTRVYYSVGGTASPPGSLPVNTVDYNGVPSAVFDRYLDIPPVSATASLIITPVDDTRVEGDESAVFTIADSNSYVHDDPSDVTLVILDNETTGPVVIDSGFDFDLLAPQKLRFRFSQNVNASLSSSDLSVTGPSGAVPFQSPVYDNSTNIATFTLSSPIPDGNYTATLTAAGIVNSVGTPMASNFVLNFFFLNADATRDRSVGGADFNILATNFGTSGKTFSQGNFSYDANGDVNSADFNILATNFGTTLPGADEQSRGGASGSGSSAGGVGASGQARRLAVGVGDRSRGSLFSGSGRVGDGETDDESEGMFSV